MKWIFTDLYDTRETGDVAACLQAFSCMTATRQGPSVMEIYETDTDRPIQSERNDDCGGGNEPSWHTRCNGAENHGDL